MLQEHARAAALGPGVQHIVSERFACFLQQGHDAVTLGLGLANDHLGLAPMDILQFKRSELFVAQSGGGDEQQDGAVPYVHRRGHVDRVDGAPDILPCQPRWQVGQPIARRTRDKPGKILAVEARTNAESAGTCGHAT